MREKNSSWGIPNLSRQQRSERWEGSNASTSYRREPTSTSQWITSRRFGKTVVLEEIADYFRSQADLLTILRERLRLEFTNTNPMAEVKPVWKIVIIYDDNLPPIQWLKGGVVTVFLGQDDKVWVAQVKISSRVFKQPIQKLALLQTD